ncbi:hypothetical protein AM588_10004799 [Phytophthora nicotianae]|uniref:Alkyl transferase n=1 Tax=Phytophthora nicotianae TaxID=4792 RepID=A0A0W8CW88_PHYNI|nr:hypothetical protein AM588_10004799 [Phytophthora nicotianae]
MLANKRPRRAAAAEDSLDPRVMTERQQLAFLLRATAPSDASSSSNDSDSSSDSEDDEPPRRRRPTKRSKTRATQNWNREQSEVDALMNLFNQFMHEIVPEALKRDVRVRVLVSDGRKLPAYIVEAIEEIETKTQNCSKFSLNLCVSYGARDEIVGACRKIATEVVRGETSVEDINEDLVSQRMLTAGLPDPDILIRTSGELRISNFLLFQIAYSELIFMDKMWPEMTKDDVEGIIMEFNRRKRRFGK